MSKAQFAKPGDLLPNPWNTNRMTPEGETKLDESLRRFGCFKPVVVREIALDGETKLEILGGEHRAQSAERIGLAKVPINNLGPIDDKTAKEISLADNARYGADDALALAEMIKELGEEDIQSFLPYADTDITALFASQNIALGELELDENFDARKELEKAPDEPRAPKTPRTHTIMRFKVTVADAETIAEIITRTKVAEGFTASDDLTNAGDALAHLLLSVNPDE